MTAKQMTLKLKHADGDKLTWKMYRDARTPAVWMLRDHNGYERTLEATYALSVPRVKLIAENHGCEFMHAFN